MKILKYVMVIVLPVFFLSCSNDKVKVKEDPAKIDVPDNNSANNPSLADTAYKKLDSAGKKDSVR